MRVSETLLRSIHTRSGHSDLLDGFLALEGPVAWLDACLERPQYFDADFLLTLKELHRDPALRSVFTILGAHIRLTEALARLGTRPTVREWIEEIGLAHYLSSDRFPRIVETREEIGGVPPGTREHLRQLETDLEARLAAVNGFKTSDPEHFNPLTTDPITLDYFHVLCRREASRSDEEAEETATQCFQMLESLETLGYNLAQLAAGRANRRNRTSGQAESWWADEHFLVPLAPIARSLANDELSFEAACEAAKVALASFLENAIARNTNNPEEAEGPPPTKQEFLAYGLAAFLNMAWAVRPTATQARESCRQFGLLLDEAGFRELSAGHRASLVLRFAFLVFASPDLRQDRSLLGEARTRLTGAFDTIGPATEFSHPGLRRDLHLMRARVQQELARWDPGLTQQAIEEFQRGLSVPWARFDREARGRALGDLASAYASLPGREQPAQVWIESLFDEALSLLPKEEFPSNRALVLLNLGIFHNERTDGTRSHHQERSLRCLEQALSLLRPDLEQRGPGPQVADPLTCETAASIYMCMGNVMRARSFGGADPGAESLGLPSPPDPHATAALERYRSGLAVLSKHGHETVRGLLHLNIGFTQRRMRSGDYGITEFEEAVRLSAEQPVLHARAQNALVEARVDYAEQLGEGSDTEDLLRILRDAETVGISHNDDELAALAAATTADVHLAVRPQSLKRTQEANDALKRALDHLNGTGLTIWRIEASIRRSGLLQALAANDQADDDGRTARLEEALGVLTSAEGLLAARSTHASGLMPRQHEDWLRTSVAAELLWLAAGGDRGSDVARLLQAAVAQEPDTTRLRLGTHELDSGERAVLHAEGQLLRASGRATAEEHLADLVDQLEEVGQDSARAHVRLLLRESGTSAQAPLGDGHDSGAPARLQLVLSSQGTVAALHAADEPVVWTRIAMTRARLSALLHGPGGWIETNSSIKEDLNPAFPAATDALIGALWDDLLTHAKADLGLDEFEDLGIVAGAFSGLPLHAALLQDGRLPKLRSLAYVLPSKLVGPRPIPQRALLIASSPTEKKTLPRALEEVVEIANMLADKGVVCELLVGRGKRFGAEALAQEGLTCGKGVEILEGFPTADRLLERSGDADFLLFSGHGQGRGHAGGSLVLFDEGGKAATLDIHEFLSRAQRTALRGVVLSACETAWESEPLERGTHSMASAFLRRGAQFVFASIWPVRDEDAPVVSREFVKLWISGRQPEEAYVGAVRALMRQGADASRWGAATLWTSRGLRS